MPLNGTTPTDEYGNHLQGDPERLRRLADKLRGLHDAFDREGPEFTDIVNVLSITPNTPVVVATEDQDLQAEFDRLSARPLDAEMRNPLRAVHRRLGTVSERAESMRALVSGYATDLEGADASFRIMTEGPRRNVVNYRNLNGFLSESFPHDHIDGWRKEYRHARTELTSREYGDLIAGDTDLAMDVHLHDAWTNLFGTMPKFVQDPVINAGPDTEP